MQWRLDMNWMLKFIVMTMAGLLSIVSVAYSDNGQCDDLVKQSEQLWMKHNFDESDQILDEAMKICPDRAELYWRKARNEYERLETIPRDQKPEKKVLIERYLKAEALADRCIELDPNDGACYLLKGTCLGRAGTTRGVLRSLFTATDIEGSWLKGIELKPTYRSEDGTSNTMADLNYALGMFYRVVPTWLCYFPFKQIVGTCGDLDKSVDCQKKAAELEPGRIEFRRELAASLVCRGQKQDRPEDVEEGLKILKEMQSMPEIKAWDKIDKVHAAMLLKDPSLACGYQRDAQQEWEEADFKK